MGKPPPSNDRIARVVYYLAFCGVTALLLPFWQSLLVIILVTILANMLGVWING